MSLKLGDIVVVPPESSNLPDEGQPMVVIRGPWPITDKRLDNHGWMAVEVLCGDGQVWVYPVEILELLETN